MYCQKCGTKLNENDKFCGMCGNPVNNTSPQIPVNINLSKETYQNVVNNLKDVTYSNNGIINIFNTYIKKPITIFEEFKEKDTFNASIAMFILFPIIYGLLSILYSIELVNGVISFIKNLPMKMAKFGIMSSMEAAETVIDIQTDKEFLTFAAKAKTFLNKGDIFKYSALSFFLLMLITFIVVLVINTVMLNKKINFKSILFIVGISYIPFILAFVVQLIIGVISISFSNTMLAVSFSLTTVTLYKGIHEYSQVSKDKVFHSTALVIFVTSLVIMIVTGKVVNQYIVKLVRENMLNQIMNLIF
ncbi:zinc ribbon domain-containing protein [Clostridium sp. SYSU_GA19001]|uniref:zinc ribbon domain-containing protein n=1 Tax=Clostridium caldaquaticum TaxID=2940653 RepID=UPI0020774227|nr:zinc ribbon domain-containing protein [Clostridium caldaquaticum]MCM8710080.1 zinc ribbon domain-containing protein [Clostridium caldaquaticum]